ncbi:hypothetical protein NL676_035318 [Syzygium grande]|nr:hypothetical protein NL676_035318 [Syzygium grande]
MRLFGLYPKERNVTTAEISFVPEKLWQSYKEACTPHVIVMRPYYRPNQSVMPMEDHKLGYLQSFLRHNWKCHLKNFIERIKSWEDSARSCYEEQINLRSDESAEMTLLDGIFMIQFFLMYGSRE